MRVVIEVPCTGGQLRVVRRLVSAWADAVAAAHANLPLVTTELVSNALNASPPDASVIVRLEREADRWSVTVVDEGPGFRVESFEVPPPDAPRGRGLALVNEFVDSIVVDRIDGLTVVTATRHLRQASAATSAHQGQPVKAVTVPQEDGPG